MMANPLPMNNRCVKCGEWFHNAHACAAGLLVLAEYWKDKCSEARIERDELRYRCYLSLDAFDEHDICDAFAGLPVEYFNPGPDFGA